jgi:hypothetical protein
MINGKNEKGLTMNGESIEIDEYTRPTKAIDSDNEAIIEKAVQLTSHCGNDLEKAVALFYFVRDSIHYSVYMILQPDSRILWPARSWHMEGATVSRRPSSSPPLHGQPAFLRDSYLPG